MTHPVTSNPRAAPQAAKALDARLPIALLLAALVIAAILVLPRFFEAARVLAQGTAPPGLLVHREGRIIGASDCFRPETYDGESAMQVSIDDAKGMEIVTIPCLDDRRVLASPPAHVLGADVDSRQARAGRVWNVTLDARTLLSPDAIAQRRRQRGDDAGARRRVREAGGLRAGDARACLVAAAHASRDRARGVAMIPGMATPGSYEHLRPGALALLADGNSVESVARVLGVPDTVLLRWRDAPPEPSPGAIPPASAPHMLERALRFDTTLSFGASTTTRALSLCLAVLFVVVLVPTLYAMAHSQFDQGPVFKLFFVAFLVVFCGAVLAKLLRKAQIRLILGPHAIVVPHLFGRTVLPYRELSDYWLVMHVLTHQGEDDEEIEGRMLTLHSSRSGVRAIELFIDDREPLDERIVDRLDEVKRANRGAQPLTRIQDIPPA